MEASNLKNMLIIKNLPSNTIEEAIVILKGTKKVKELEKIDSQKINSNNYNKKKEKDYILKEAEMLISNYISKVENSNKTKRMTKINKNYKRLKTYAYISSFLIFIQFLMLLTK